MFFRHHRFQIWGMDQHPYRHSASDIAYSGSATTNAAFGADVINLQQAIDWIVKVIYPRVKDDVATPGDLPPSGNSLNDYRVVRDDGDGNPAAYRWEQREGDVAAKWYKVADYDWSSDAILSAFEDKTQGLFVYKLGMDDADFEGNALTGDDAGQHLWGGVSANTHLTLHANSGDGTGPQTGYVQFADNVRPFTDSSLSLGTNTYRWLNVYTDEAQVGTLNVTDGSITDSGGQISFDDEDLTTTGDVTAASFIAGTLTISGGSIVDTDGEIDFGATDLTTTGVLTADSGFIGDIAIAGSLITTSVEDGDIDIAADGAGTVNIHSPLETGNITTTGAVTITGQLDVDNLRLDGNTLSATSGNVTISGATTVTGSLTANSVIVDNLTIDGNTISSTNTNGNILLDPNGTGQITAYSKVSPDSDNANDLGAGTFRWGTLYLGTEISDGTDSFAIADLMSFSAVGTPQNGDTLFWNSGTGRWEASAPDLEIDHGSITGLSDDDHTQYALLAGRSGGQSITGGTDASDNLLLQSTSNATKGAVLVGDDLLPDADATHDLGSSSAQWADLHLAGQAYGLRAENFADATARGAATPTEGRIGWQVDTEELYIGLGAAWKNVSTDAYYNEDAVNWDGATTTVTYDVSAYTDNARAMIWQFKINSADFEITNFKIDHPTQTTVRVTVEEALAAGTYTLVGR